jgi:multiple sugar transport system substrate-binding protein
MVRGKQLTINEFKSKEGVVKMLKKVMTLTLGAAITLSMVLSGCGSSSPDSSNGSKTTDSAVSTAAAGTTSSDTAKKESKIKFVGFAGSEAGFQARADEFMKKHPEIKVEVQGVPATSWAELMQAISINIAGGDIPDIADIASEGQRAFAVNKVIIPLDEYIERDKAELQATLDDINPNLLNAMKIDGKTYCLPTVWNNMCLYYNKKVLKEAGLNEPKSDWTIDDFISMCQQVTKNNTGKNDKWGYAFANQYFLTLVPWMLVNDGNVLSDDWTTSRLADPNTISAVQMLHDFVYKYKFSPKLDAGVSDFDLFVQNKLAFMGAGMWQVNGLKNAKFSVNDYDVVNFPKVKSNKQIMGIGGAPIFSASENKDAAWEFAKFLSGKEFQETFVVNDGWSIPSTKSAADKLLTKDFFPKNGKIFYESANIGTLVPAPQEYGTIEQTLTRTFGAIMADSMSVEEGMKAADKAVTEALAKRAK